MRLSVVIPSYRDPLLQKTINDLILKSELGDQLEIIEGHIYLITNILNGKRYIGQTIGRVEQRWSQHLCNAKRGHSYPLYNAINKYGRDNFEVTILAKAYSIQVLNLLESVLIKKMGTMAPNGYNARTGGGNSRLSELTRKKLSFIRRGRPGVPHTEEFKRRLSERNAGNTYSLGRKKTDTEKEKHRLASTRYVRNSSGQFSKQK